MAGHRIIGFKEPKEIAITRKGMNEHATAIVLKSFGETKPPESLESSEMEAKIMKALLGLDEVTKAYALTLTDEALKAFADMPAPDQMKAAKDAKDKADALAHGAIAANVEPDADDKTKSAYVIALEKAVKTGQDQFAELKKAFEDKNETTEIEKAAAHADFVGFPGGAEKLVPLIKAARALPDEQRDLMIGLAKSQAEGARMLAKTLGYATPLEEVAKSAPATYEVEKGVKALADEKKIDVSKARGQYLADPANARAVQAMYEEQGIV